MKYTPAYICAMVKSRYIGDGHPTFNRESLLWVYKPLLLGWFSHPLLCGNNGSLDPGTYEYISIICVCKSQYLNNLKFPKRRLDTTTGLQQPVANITSLPQYPHRTHPINVNPFDQTIWSKWFKQSDPAGNGKIGNLSRWKETSIPNKTTFIHASIWAFSTSHVEGLWCGSETAEKKRLLTWHVRWCTLAPFPS